MIGQSWHLLTLTPNLRTFRLLGRFILPFKRSSSMYKKTFFERVSESTDTPFHVRERTFVAAALPHHELEEAPRTIKCSVLFKACPRFTGFRMFSSPDIRTNNPASRMRLSFVRMVDGSCPTFRRLVKLKRRLLQCTVRAP
jgi:hypothetical protein